MLHSPPSPQACPRALIGQGAAASARLALSALSVATWLFTHGLALSAQATPSLQRLSVKAPLRYDAQRPHQAQALTRSRTQLQVTGDLHLRLIGSAAHGLQLATLIGSGDSFTSQWSTLYDHNTGDQNPIELSARQLYLHYAHPSWRLSAGVIPPIKGVVSNTSMDRDGWIRGARLVFNVGEGGLLELVSGAVDQLSSPSVFQAPSTWNYHELEWTHDWPQPWRTELGAVSLDGDRIARAELLYRARLKPLQLKSELSGELLYNYDAEAFAYDLMWVLSRAGYELKLEYSEIDARFGLLGTLVNDFFSLGSSTLIGLKGPLSLRGVSWFTRVYLNEDVTRGMIGVAYSLRIVDAE